MTTQITIIFYHRHHEMVDSYEITISQMAIGLFHFTSIFFFNHRQDYYWTWLYYISVYVCLISLIRHPSCYWYSIVRTGTAYFVSSLVFSGACASELSIPVCSLRISPTYVCGIFNFTFLPFCQHIPPPMIKSNLFEIRRYFQWKKFKCLIEFIFKFCLSKVISGILYTAS